MSLQTIEINSAKITFDRERTLKHRTTLNTPCSCQYCGNYYKNIEKNTELVEFLSDFGIDYNCDEEIFFWDLGNSSDSLIHYEGYYGVLGKIDSENFFIERYGVKITFSEGAAVPCDITDEYFWICVEGDFPYILEEKRELPLNFTQKIANSNFAMKIKNIFKKN